MRVLLHSLRSLFRSHRALNGGFIQVVVATFDLDPCCSMCALQNDRTKTWWAQWKALDDYRRELRFTAVKGGAWHTWVEIWVFRTNAVWSMRAQLRKTFMAVLNSTYGLSYGGMFQSTRRICCVARWRSYSFTAADAEMPIELTERPHAHIASRSVSIAGKYATFVDKHCQETYEITQTITGTDRHEIVLVCCDPLHMWSNT